MVCLLRSVPTQWNRWALLVMVGWLIPSLAYSQSSQPYRDGYLFVDGQYVPSPYEISRRDGVLTINGREFTEEYFALDSLQPDPGLQRGPMGRRLGMMRRGPRAGGGPGFYQRDPLDRIAGEIQMARMGATVSLYEKELPLVLYPTTGAHEMLKALRGDAIAATSPPSILGASARQHWDRLIDEFQPSSEFLARAEVDIKRVEEAEVAGDRLAAANQWVARISYPLTVFAMIVVVLAFGHLLSNRPMLAAETSQQARQQVVVKSLVIVALLSIVDLVWTIMAGQTTAMRELNPLGSQLMDDPSLLILFKAAVTGASITILYCLHRRPVAQIASWWCCLLLTLLTARWVVFQSMFL